MSSMDSVDSGTGNAGSRERKRTFCRVCEPACGMIATVEDGSLVRLEANRKHPVSQGFVCNKGIYGLDIHNDPERLRRPLRRMSNGGFEEIGWDAALAGIAERLGALRERHGASAITGYVGNPAAHDTLGTPSYGRFMRQLGAHRHFDSGTQDCANKFAGSATVFGTRTLHPLPDIGRSDFILILGENPAVSHMSFISVPHPMRHLKEAEARGAMLLYVNPRRIESAAIAADVLKIRPDTDVYLLAALLHEIDRIAGFHRDAADHGNRVEELRRFVAGWPARRVAGVTGIAATEIRALAADFASAGSACVHMSTGVNMGRQGTLAYWLVHILALVTGNLGRPGGNFHSLGFYERAAASGRSFAYERQETPFGAVRRPGGGIGLPGNLMADYIADPVKALFVTCGNPVLSIGGGERLREALDGLDLMVSVDIYRNTTAEYAHYLLPAAGAFEREDINIAGLGLQLQPCIQLTEAIVPPAYQRKPDWWIWESLSAAMGFRSAFDGSGEPDMWARVDAMLRSGGRSMDDLREAQVVVLEPSAPESLWDRVQHDDGRIDCCPPAFADAIARMDEIFTELEAASAGQLKLIGKRDAYMLNSWYANVGKLKTGRRDRNYLFMHPADARRRRIASGDRVCIANEYGQVDTEAKLTDELMEGDVAMTHGWGHQRSGGMRVARARPGVNGNVLLPSGPGSFEPLSNQAHMTGIAVEVTPLARDARRGPATDGVTP